MSITDMQALSELQRDALREVANIGAAHAATALSLMTGTKIMISVPTITVAPLAELAQRRIGQNLAREHQRRELVSCDERKGQNGMPTQAAGHLHRDQSDLFVGA